MLGLREYSWLHSQEGGGDEKSPGRVRRIRQGTHEVQSYNIPILGGGGGGILKLQYALMSKGLIAQKFSAN